MADLFWLVISAGLWTASPASSAPIAFDCDVPPDHFSSVSQDVVGPLMVKGLVRVAQLRSGNNLPVAGARLASLDGENSVSFQLVAASTHAKQFDVVLNLKRGSEIRRATLGQIAVDESVSFTLSLDDEGKTGLVISGRNYNADFMPIARGTASAFCSTAQFKFSDLSFSDNARTEAAGAS